MTVDHAELSHGSARIQALNALLQSPPGTSSEQLAANALRAGLPVGSQLRVALHASSDRDIETRRRMASFGSLHEAGSVDGLAATIITVQEARALSRSLVGDLHPRWEHLQAVGRRMEELCEGCDLPEHLAVAAWLHDIGYAPEIASTGFHPLDGARFLTERGKILPSRLSGTCARHQRQLSTAIKRARELALLPYIKGHVG